MAEEKESPISICQVVQNPKKGDCNKSSNFIISTTRASWKRGLKWCQPEACWTSLRGEIRSMITSPPSNWLMTFLKWIQRPCPTKLQNPTNQLHHILLKICCFNNYSEFPCAGSWGLWSNFTQAPLNRWDLVSVFQNWSFFGKMEIQAISVRPWPNFSTPTPFDSAPLFVTSYKPPWLHKKSPASWHWFDWFSHAVAHECQDSKVTHIKTESIL